MAAIQSRWGNRKVRDVGCSRAATRRVAEIRKAAIARANEVAAELAGRGLDDEGLSNFAKMIAERAERCAIIFHKTPE